MQRIRFACDNYMSLTLRNHRVIGVCACLLVIHAVVARAVAQIGVSAPPVAAWAGDIDTSRIFGVAIDDQRNIYLAGFFRSDDDLDPTEGVSEAVSNGGEDAYVTKLSVDGSYLWSYTIGGVEDDTSSAIVVAADGTLIVTGLFEGTVDFDPGPSVVEHTSVVGINTFVTWVSPKGQHLSTLVFGQGTDQVRGSVGATDRDGNLLINGSFFGTADFDPGKGEDFLSSFPTAFGLLSSDAYVTKLSADGLHIWTKTIGGPGFDTGRDVAVDSQGDVFLLGSFRNDVDFDPGPGEDVITAQDVDAPFITKLGADGSYRWTRPFPIRGVNAMCVAADDNVYVAGSYTGVIDFDPTEGVDFGSSTLGGGDIFITKINGDGSYGWTITFAGLGSESARDITLDAAGNIFLTGRFFGQWMDFDPGYDEDIHFNEGFDDLFVTKLNADLSYGWTRTIGSESGEIGQLITVDTDGAIIVTGFFRSPLDFDPGCEVDTHDTVFVGLAEAYILKLVQPQPTADITGDGVVDLRDVALWQTCFTGEGIDGLPGPGGITPFHPVCNQGCGALDLDGDDDIDLTDYALLLQDLQAP